MLKLPIKILLPFYSYRYKPYNLSASKFSKNMFSQYIQYHLSHSALHSIITISISFLLFTPFVHDIFALTEKTEMKNENKSIKKKNKKSGSQKDIPLFDHDYIISRLFDSIFEMDTGRTILSKKIKTFKTNNINSKTNKGKK